MKYKWKRSSPTAAVIGFVTWESATSERTDLPSAVACTPGANCKNALPGLILTSPNRRGAVELGTTKEQVGSLPMVQFPSRGENRVSSVKGPRALLKVSPVLPSFLFQALADSLRPYLPDQKQALQAQLNHSSWLGGRPTCSSPR